MNGTAVPAIRPVAVPEITSLQGGQIMVGVNTTVPTQIKVPHCHACAHSVKGAYSQLPHTPAKLNAACRDSKSIAHAAHAMLSVKEALMLERLQVGRSHVAILCECQTLREVHGRQHGRPLCSALNSITLGLHSQASLRLLRLAIVQQALVLQAFTWNGFEDGTTWLGGLWAGKTTEQGDFATLVYRAQLYGFNAVRIPFR